MDLAAMPRKELEEYAKNASQEANRLQQLLEGKEAELRLLRQQRFGRKSEKRIREPEVEGQEQMCLFNEAEVLGEEEAEEPKAEKVLPRRSGKKKGRKEDVAKKLPKRTLTYVLGEEEAVCPQCNRPMATMKKVVRKEIEVIPAKVVVTEHITWHYVCRACEKTGVRTPIVHAASPKPLLRGSLLSPSMAAYLVMRKYENREPVHHVCKDLQSQGLALTEATLCNWILRTAEVYAKPLYQRMWETLLQCSYLQVDETPFQVLGEPGRSAASKSYMWVFCTNHTERPLVLYRYADTRSGKVLQEALGPYGGWLQCDGYDAYNALADARRVGCFAHVRRKFHEAKAALDPKLPPQAREKEEEALERCDQLFALDREVKKLPEGRRLEWKKAHIQKEMEQFFAWLKQQESRSGKESETFRKAIGYALHEQPYLEQYLSDGRIELSNNLAERSIRPFTIGRKNWMFCKSPRGAQASAIWYSIAITAKENGLLLFEYLRYVLEELRGVDPSSLSAEALDRLLPWSEQLPDCCFRKKQDMESEKTRTH